MTTTALQATRRPVSPILPHASNIFSFSARLRLFEIGIARLPLEYRRFYYLTISYILMKIVVIGARAAIPIPPHSYYAVFVQDWTVRWFGAILRLLRITCAGLATFIVLLRDTPGAAADSETVAILASSAPVRPITK
jgi:hypothetical protein